MRLADANRPLEPHRSNTVFKFAERLAFGEDIAQDQFRRVRRRTEQ